MSRPSDAYNAWCDQVLADLAEKGSVTLVAQECPRTSRAATAWLTPAMVGNRIRSRAMLQGRAVRTTTTSETVTIILVDTTESKAPAAPRAPKVPKALAPTPTPTPTPAPTPTATTTATPIRRRRKSKSVEKPTLQERARAMVKAKRSTTYGELVKALGLTGPEQAMELLHGGTS